VLTSIAIAAGFVAFAGSAGMAAAEWTRRRKDRQMRRALRAALTELP